MPDDQENTLSEANAPVEMINTASRHREPAEGIALCLSGGGYRAMLFHLGSLWRINELGLLKKLDRISSVSGGSITAGLLGMNWKKLEFNAAGIAANYKEMVVDPIRYVAGKTIDRKAIFTGVLAPGSISDKLADAYSKYLFKDKTLQDLPDDPPRFVFNATNVQSGALWRFMKPYMRDWKVGEVKNPMITLAVAVAASSAFPPVLSPTELELESDQFTPGSGAQLQKEPFTTDVLLTDGGVYDNLGLETAWKRYKTILVSDAGGQMAPEGDPKRDWAGHTLRVLNLIDNQVRSLRKRQVIGSFVDGTRKGAYWGIRTNIGNYQLPDALDCPYSKTMQIANIKTRLKSLDRKDQKRLINWGYAVSDAALRKHLETSAAAPAGFPYPNTGI
jgi:NTE family protein